MSEQLYEKKMEECISIKGCKIILRYGETQKTNVLDIVGNILCGQKYAPEICRKS